MRIFISFASEDRQIAEKVHFALKGSGYDTFYDKESLPAGGDYIERIASGVSRSDIFVFLASPDSLRRGNYALTELEYAERKWSHPKNRVLPVLIRGVTEADLPAYLTAVTVSNPTGNIESKVLADVSRMAARIRRKRLSIAASIVVPVISVVLGWRFWSGPAVSSIMPLPSRGATIGGTFAYPSFGTGDDLVFCGAATRVDGAVELTSLADNYQVGAVWYLHRVAVTKGFQTAFIFGIRRPTSGVGSDGFAFVIQADRVTAVGDWGGNLGYNGIRRSLAVEFDMIWNSDLYDPNGNHVSIQTRYGQANSANHDKPISIGYSNSLTVNLSDSSLHTGYIDYDGTMLSVYVDDRTTPVVSTQIDLSQVVGSSDGLAWVGLTAASGAWAQAHELRSWKLDANAPFERAQTDPRSIMQAWSEFDRKRCRVARD